MSKRPVIWIAGVVGVIVACCLVWQVRNSKSAGLVVEQKATEVLRIVCSLELTNSWRTVNASGGMVGSPFTNIRWWKEYFWEGEGDFESLDNWSRELGKRKHTPDFFFMPSSEGFTPGIMPHGNSTHLAPWWKPETNKEAMFMYAGINSGRCIVHLYGYKRGTNSVVYIHIIEN